MKPLIWIIDEEWPDHKMEVKLITDKYPDATIKCSNYEYLEDYRAFGYRADLVFAQVYAELPAEIINGFTNCKGIAIFGGGYDRVNIEAAKEKGIPVTNVQGYCAQDIADYVLNAVLTANKAASFYSSRISNGKWGLTAMTKLNSRINEQTVMIVGLGKIGKTVANELQKIGLSVVSYDPNVSAETMLAKNIKPVGLIEGLRMADYVSVHCNLTPKTTNLLGSSAFKAMKTSSFLINTARGKIVDEEALIRAVNQNEISGAQLDVVKHEPPILSENIFHTNGILVTPHISYLSKQSINELRRRTIQNGLAMYQDKYPADVVN